MNIFYILAASCPLLLCSMGALFSEYAGILALYLDGLITFSAFLTFLFTTLTKNIVLAQILTSILVVGITFLLSWFIEKFKANQFIAAIAINLLFGALPSLFSFVFFNTRGVITSETFNFNLFDVRVYAVTITFILLTVAILFLTFSKQGLYLRITGSDKEVLIANGIKPAVYRITSWSVAALFASVAGGILAMRVNSFVPNISSGRGWMALAAVFLGKKKNWRIIAGVIIFCFADIFSANIQNYFPFLQTSFVLSLPYFVILLCCIF